MHRFEKQELAAAALLDSKNKRQHNLLIKNLTYNEQTGEFTTKYDTTRRAQGQRCGTLRKDGTYIVSFEGKLYTVGRLAYFWKFGRWPAGPVIVRSKTGTIFDYRWDNLVFTAQDATQDPVSA